MSIRVIEKNLIQDHFTEGQQLGLSKLEIDIPEARNYTQVLNDLSSVYFKSRINKEGHNAFANLHRRSSWYREPYSFYVIIGMEEDTRENKWFETARNIILSNDSRISWNESTPTIPVRLLENELMSVDPSGGEKILVSNLLDRRFLFERTSSNPDDYTEVCRFVDPNLLYKLASEYYMAGTENYIQVIEKLRNDGIFNLNHPESYIPLLEYVSEEILLSDKGSFADFISAMTQSIGDEKGFAVSAAVLDSIGRIFGTIFNQASSPEFGRYDRKIEFESAREKLLKEYRNWKYQHREFVIPPQILEDAIENPLTFWDKLFYGLGIDEEMKVMFEVETDEKIKSIYETALRERKVVAGSMLLAGQILGYDPVKTKQLAALAQFNWGMIVSYDNIVDNHLMRKNAPADSITFGKAKALDKVMLSLGKIIKRSISDPRLANSVLDMLTASCNGDYDSREFTFSDNPLAYLKNMEKLGTAFSWIPIYMGQETGHELTGVYLTSVFRNINTIGQMINDIDDPQPNEKHEAGSDFTNRISLYWRTLISLDENFITPTENARIIWIYTDAMKQQFISAEDLACLLEIGNRPNVKKEIVRKLLPFAEKYHHDALEALEQTFNPLEPLDDLNKIYKHILKIMLDTLKGNLWNY